MRKMILPIVLGLLLGVSGALYFMGYWKTWEDYRGRITEETGQCYADIIISTGENLGCQPWNDPYANIDECVSKIDTFSQMLFAMAMLTCPVQEGVQIEDSSHI